MVQCRPHRLYLITYEVTGKQTGAITVPLLVQGEADDHNCKYISTSDIPSRHDQRLTGLMENILEMEKMKERGTSRTCETDAFHSPYLLSPINFLKLPMNSDEIFTVKAKVSEKGKIFLTRWMRLYGSSQRSGNYMSTWMNIIASEREK